MPYILEEYHHRVFGGVSSITAHFLRPEWNRMQHIQSYMILSPEQRSDALAGALAAQDASDAAKVSRQDNSTALMQADALRWLAYRKERLQADDARAFRDLLSFWAVEFHKSVMSLDFPTKWKKTKAGALYETIVKTSELMLVQEKPSRDFPNATWENGMILWNAVYHLNEELDTLLYKLTGGAPRPVLNRPIRFPVKKAAKKAAKARKAS
ncbi:MAG: hypothetical protein FJ039_12420 [Chloroflexi bacterium]|nr:hypothetical protein [Chloroflexota bacterium]